MAEPKIADLQKLIASLDSRLKTAEATIAKHETRIKDVEGFESRIKTVEGRVTDAWTFLNELRDDMKKKADR